MSLSWLKKCVDVFFNWNLGVNDNIIFNVIILKSWYKCIQETTDFSKSVVFYFTKIWQHGTKYKGKEQI